MNAPAKREGACSNAPFPKLTGLAEVTSGSGFTQHVCRHNTTRVELMLQGHTHYGKEICAVCGRFIRWLPQPETIERRTLNAFKLARLAMRPDLTGWERKFIGSVGEKKHPSSKQQRVLSELFTRYLEGAP